jgi:hypothetical protein
MKKKLNIVQFLGGLDTGGAEKIVKDYSIFLNKNGHNLLIPIIFESIDSPYIKELVENEISVKVLLGKYSNKIINRVIVKLRTLFNPIQKRLKFLFNSFKPDVIHLHGFVLKY